MRCCGITSRVWRTVGAINQRHKEVSSSICWFSSRIHNSQLSSWSYDFFLCSLCIKIGYDLGPRFCWLDCWPLFGWLDYGPLFYWLDYWPLFCWLASFVVADLRIATNHSRTVPQIIMYRKLKAINIAYFKAYIEIVNWLDILKPTELNWLNNMTVFSALSSIFIPNGYQRHVPQPPDPWMTFCFLTNIVDIWRTTAVKVWPH